MNLRLDITNNIIMNETSIVIDETTLCKVKDKWQIINWVKYQLQN